MYSAPLRFAVVRGIGAKTLLPLLLVATANVAQAAPPVPKNLGNGLDKLVQTKVPAYFDSAAQEQGSAVDSMAIKDSEGRVLVRINPTGNSAAGKPTANARTLRSSLPSVVSSLNITAVDENYHGVGVMNAFVDLADIPALASAPGVRSVVLEWKPRHGPALPPEAAELAKAAARNSAVIGETLFKLGTVFDQGVTQHRVDQINQFYNPLAPVDYEGQNMSIGFISNCYAAHTANPASLDVTNFDLPGAAGNTVNSQPVVVLQDDLSSTGCDDEGRGMIQIGYKMAPKARLAFATADGGEVGFANNIRALAGIPGYTYDPLIQQGFAADTICDDVGYFDEPFFQDGIIGAGANDAAAAGVAYFSSAANDIGVNGYESEIRVVPNDPTNSGALTFAGGNQALVNTNINLAGVPANLYAGGFHNFNPNPGQQDIAQLVNIAANNTVATVLEWNDPYDQNGGVTLGPALYQNTGNFTTTPIVFDATSTPPVPSLTAGKTYQVVEEATTIGYDAIVTVKDPSGNIVAGPQDTGVNETVTFQATVNGQYTYTFDHFSTTTGPFKFTVNEIVSQTPLVVSDWNLLAFRTDTGAYVPGSSLTADNFLTNEPVELGFTNRTNATNLNIQFVFARSNTPPAGARVADRIRYQIPGNGRAGYGPAEYFTYNTVTTAGHAMANGTNGMAAYSVFRPSLPETFTSPGPVRIYFDAAGNPLPLPEIRRQPRLAAADAGNVSANMVPYFAGDASSDPDPDGGNFSGTSAAGPHAAAIAALVLQAHGGRHSLTPEQVTTILESTAIHHDLDPSYAAGAARTANGEKVMITVSSDGSSNLGTGQNDANSFSITYTGAGNLTSITFNPQGTAATGGNVSGGNNGYIDTPASNPASGTYFENSYPGMVFAPGTKAFTVGSGSTVVAGAVTPSFSNVAPLPSNGTTQTWTMNLALDGSMTNGKVLRFTVGRGIQHSSSLTGGSGPTGGTTSAGNLGDLFGGGIALPNGVVNANGMTFSGTTSTGGTFSGVIKNRLGAGYSPVDGYGFIDAAAAAGAPAP